MTNRIIKLKKPISVLGQETPIVVKTIIVNEVHINEHGKIEHVIDVSGNKYEWDFLANEAVVYGAIINQLYANNQSQQTAQHPTDEEVAESAA